MAGSFAWEACPVPDLGVTSYSERLRVPVVWWLLGLAFVVSVGWAFYVATPITATVVAVIVSAVIVGSWLWSYGRAEVRVDDTTFYAGRGVLPLTEVGGVEALDAEATRRALGPGADARAFLVTRPYCREAVRIEVADRSDPAPYWLVSTRHPSAVAARLRGHSVTD